jgi:two-component system response regulator
MDIALHHLELPYHLLNLPDRHEVIRYLQREGEYRQPDAFPRPEIVLLDLARTDAFDVLCWIRKTPETRHLPVIVLADSVFDPEIARAYKEGASSFLVKAYGFPAILDQLREIDSQWVRPGPLPPTAKERARKRRRPAEPTPPNGAASSGGTLGFNGSEGLGIQAAI